ncbi:hypothetical protein J2Z76_000264 [Sedimentibacter acidaminivorans]|uniref:SLH domain-containing protein n=1 Tax=Sedimentibacter acidaminivorans TaxID=913099 RepID=A0ABS4G9R0_9FIRM|nr:S-layer homology domain-containing protein [Sedimentibacter acidaminivorans]MBP1924411.1 hypothetical protein [Sedimentibacter acidaminivorans]
MKKVILIILAIVLCFGSIGSMSNYCYAGTAPDIISEGTYTSPTLIKKQYSKTYLTTMMMDMGPDYTGIIGGTGVGHYMFFPAESGDYKITIRPDSVEFGFSVTICDDNNPVYYNDDVRDNSCEATISVDKGTKYYITIEGESIYPTKPYYIIFDKPLVAPLMYTAGTGGSITGETTQILLPDGTGTEVTAVPDSGYVFSQWSDGVLTASRTDAYATDGIDITAEFSIFTIDSIDDINIDSLSASLPKATVRENGEIVTGKTVKYTCKELTDYGARISSSDRWIGLDSSIPNGTYTVTVSLADDSAVPVTFNINFAIPIPPEIALTPESVDLVKGGTDDYFYVDFPTVAVYDGEGNLSDDEYGICGADFGDYLTEPPTDKGFKLSKDIPLGTYHLTYGLSDDDTITNDFEIVVRNPQIDYTAGTGGSITGETSQTIEPRSSGTEVTAVPDDGYTFSQWSDGVTTASRTDENVTGDITVTAEFSEAGVELTIDENSVGDTLQDKVETILDGKSNACVIALNIIEGILTDDDVLWLTSNLTQIETLSITDEASFTDDTLPNNAFEDLKKLKSVTMDLDTTESLSFGDYAFAYCYLLEEANLPQAVTFGVASFRNDYKLNNVILPNAKSFGGNSFNECQALTEISLPNTETVGIASFVHCINLKNVDLPKLEVVKYQTFCMCDELTNVNLTNVKEFEDGIFWNCKKPIEMILGSVPPTVIFDSEQPYSGTFGQYQCEESSKILIPIDALEAYKATDGWNNGSWCGWPVETFSNASSDNTLSNLTVDNVTIQSFDSKTMIYNLESTTESSLVISATSNDSNANVTGDIGIQNLIVGSNTFTITVTAEDLTTKNYIINIVRIKSEENPVTKQVDMPTANPSGGNFRGTVQVTLASSTTGAAIYYTLDGSVPTSDKDIYITPITISETTTLKAIATTAGAIDSDVLTVIFTRNSSSNNSSSSSSNTSKNSNTVNGEADNKSFSAGTKETKYNSDGKKETVVSVNESSIKTQVDKMENGQKISIPVVENVDVVKTKLSVQSIADMQKKAVILEVKTDDASYELPTDMIDVNNILKLIGEDVSPQDIPFTVEISKANIDMLKIVENSAVNNELSIVVPPVNFKIEASYKGKTYEVEHFNSFVTRTIAIPSNVDASKITTAIVTDSDGSVRHIPTYVTKVDGKYYATINSLTNSTYTLINNEASFSDVADNYWAKADIEKMASRLVVSGKEDGTFSPDEAITRAELAGVLVKALGLKPEQVNQFADVESGTKYAGYIGTAYSYGIINGTSETTFNPEGLVTRQDAMTMIYRAGMIAGLENSEYVTEMKNYVDYEDVSDYAKEAAAWNVNNRIIVGKTETTLVPFDHITRAEISAITNRLLTSAGLID